MNLVQNSMRYVQKTFRLRLNTQNAKISVLKNYWDKILGELFQTAINTKDKSLTEVLDKIIRIPKNHQHAVLLKYVQQCQLKHAIAFLQWRKMFCVTSEKQYKELEEQINVRIEYLYTRAPLK